MCSRWKGQAMNCQACNPPGLDDLPDAVMIEFFVDEIDLNTNIVTLRCVHEGRVFKGCPPLPLHVPRLRLPVVALRGQEVNPNQQMRKSDFQACDPPEPVKDIESTFTIDKPGIKVRLEISGNEKKLEPLIARVREVFEEVNDE